MARFFARMFVGLVLSSTFLLSSENPSRTLECRRFQAFLCPLHTSVHIQRLHGVGPPSASRPSDLHSCAQGQGEILGKLRGQRFALLFSSSFLCSSKGGEKEAKVRINNLHFPLRRVPLKLLKAVIWYRFLEQNSKPRICPRPTHRPGISL